MGAPGRTPGIKNLHREWKLRFDENRESKRRNKPSIMSDDGLAQRLAYEIGALTCDMTSSPSPRVPEQYSPAQWTHDLLHCLPPGAPTTSSRNTLAAIEDYFYGNYPDDPFACWKIIRLFAAYIWIARHRHELDLPGIAVIGEEQFGISKHLAVALFRIYAANPDSLVSHDFEVEMAVRMAKEQIALSEKSTT